MNGHGGRDPEKVSRLYNPVSYIPLALVFSFILPGILFALNAGRIHGTKSRRRLLVLFLVTGAALMTSLVVFSDRVGGPTRIAFVGVNLSVGGLLCTLQLPRYRESRSSGARPRSLLVPILVATAAVALLAVPEIISLGSATIAPPP